MAEKYLKLSSGNKAEQEALVTSAGAGDAGKIVALDGTGRLDQTLMPVGVAADVSSIACTEDISAGDMLNIYDSSGAKCRKADASNNRPAHGFALSSYTNGQSVSIYHEGSNNQMSGLTPGAKIFLNTGGDASATPPSTSGHIVQAIGVATSATSFNFEPQDPITLA